MLGACECEGCSVPEVLAAVCWEQVQAMFRVGIQMPDGDLATGIGRCKREEFGARVAHSGLRLLVA